MFGRQPRAVEPPTRAPEIAPARKPTTIQPTTFISSTSGSSCGSSDGRGQSRKSRTARTKASGWVWCAAWRAPSMTTIRPSPSRSSSASVAVRKTGRLAPPRICRTGWRTAPSRSSEAAGSRLGLELAQDRAGSGRPRRPDRLRPVRGEVRRRHPDDLGHERREGAVAIAGGEPLAQARLDARRVVARAGGRRARPRS